MKYIYSICFLSINLLSFGQVKVDSETYTPQQLIEDILIDSECISNIQVTNVIGGNFGASDKSYGYFDATGTSFPLQRGIVLSTGKLLNVEGPNDRLSDDDAPNWLGDSDLESILNESNTTNATIIEFDFSSLATQVSFRYLFASEEYQVGNPNTCQYSDLFGFLIRPTYEQQYTNIALVPETQTPIKVTTVHPEIPGGCPEINENYFGSWNGTVSPINFNGQTTILRAKANLIPNATYHVKLVIADHINYRYDSAVFLEAGSFQISADLGPDRLLLNNNAICENSTYVISAVVPSIGGGSYKWYKDGSLLIGETISSLEIDEPGTYNVEIDWGILGCTSYGQVVIEYSSNPIVFNAVLTECDLNQDGITLFNLFGAVSEITDNDNSLNVTNYFYTENDAINNINPITNPYNFENSAPTQTVFARVENYNSCFSVAELQLQISNNNITIPDAFSCDGEIIDGFAAFDLNIITASFQNQIPINSTVSYYETEEDAFKGINRLNSPYFNATPYQQILFVKTTNNNQCFALSTLKLGVIESPIFSENDNIIYCLNNFPANISVESGLLNAIGNNPSYEWYFKNTLIATTNTINTNETGTYTVVVTFSNNCSSSNDITLLASNVATIESVDIKDASSNNIISIKVSGEGTYQFALDTPIYQDDPIFTNVKPGFHTIYVLDKNGCGIVQKEISVLGFPKFFTPNNDGINDFWKPFGVNHQFNSNIDIKIFDRYGKFIKQINPLSSGWNGTFNGNLLANDDYWFVVILSDGTEYKGHFTLKR